MAQALQKHGPDAIAIQADVADEEWVKGPGGRAHEHFKRLDILVNNAGIFPMKRLRELDAATWDRTQASQSSRRLPVHPARRRKNHRGQRRRSNSQYLNYQYRAYLPWYGAL